MKPYDRTTYDGRTVDWITRLALEKAADRLGYPLTITQGSYNTGVGASAGTHDGGGVVDLAAFDHERKVRVLRSIGFAAWYRSPAEGPWPAHIHAVLIGNDKLSMAAQHQVTAYLSGRNGLANNGPDTGPRQWVGVRFTWPVETRGEHVDAALDRLRKASGDGRRHRLIKRATRALNKITPWRA